MSVGEDNAGAAGAGAGTFAERLQRLFDIVPRPERQGGGTYSVDDVATATGVSRTAIYELKKGRKQPGWATVVKLASFFGVDLVYFGDDDQAAQDYAQQLELLAALSRADVTDIALRSGSLSPEHRKVLRTMLDQLHEIDHPAEQDRTQDS